MDEIKDKYYTLEDTVNRLDSIIDDISNMQYAEELNEIKYEMQNEMEELQKRIQEQEEKEARAEEQEYENSVL